MRESEVERASAVLIARERGDTRGLLDAVARFWLEPPERDDIPDDTAADVWAAIVAAGAVDQALELGLQLAREARRIRPHAFIDLCEHMESGAVRELAELGIRHGWPAVPYLAAAFGRLLELKQHKLVWQLVQAHRASLYERDDTWRHVGFVLSTSVVGDRYEAAAWFDGFEHRKDVPMWLLCAFATTITQQASSVAKLLRSALDALMTLARKAYEGAVWDDSAPYVVCLTLIDDLRNGREAEFLAGMQKHAELMARPVEPSLDHPLLQYASSFRHARPVTQGDLDFRRYLGTTYTPIGMLEAATSGAGPRPPHWQLGETANELFDFTAGARRILVLFEQMHGTEPGEAAAALMRQMAKSRPSSLPWLIKPWQRMVKARVGFRERLRFSIFG